MRQRRVTGIEERLAPFADLILQPYAAAGASLPVQADASPSAAAGASLPVQADASPSAAAGADANLSCKENIQDGKYVRWYQRRSELYDIPEGFDRIYAEFGCGRGSFINTLAKADPDGLYIGIEGCKTIIFSAIKKTHIAGLKNLFYIDSFINDAATAFEAETLDGIFLNFSDPWPKERHAERRLTSPAKARSYRKVLKPGAFVTFKTDNESFFVYSLKTFNEAGFFIEHSEHNLKAKKINGIAALAEETQTEYEQKFRSLGRPICCFTAIK